MTEKKRKSKRPKSMRVTTEATKAKLPKPKRKRNADGTVTVRERNDAGGYTYSRFNPDTGEYVGRGQPRETWAEGYAKWKAKAERAKRVQCPRCEKLVLGGPHDIHTCSPIAGQPLDGIGSAPLDVPRAIPCGEDVWVDGYNRWRNSKSASTISFAQASTLDAPPDTSAYPWGLKFAWWLDGVPTTLRLRTAKALRRLAAWVEPWVGK